MSGLRTYIMVRVLHTKKTFDLFMLHEIEMKPRIISGPHSHIDIYTYIYIYMYPLNIKYKKNKCN